MNDLNTIAHLNKIEVVKQYQQHLQEAKRIKDSHPEYAAEFHAAEVVFA